jgi:hypothetical protein
MNPILKKLKLTKQNPVLILNSPKEYEEILKDVKQDIHFIFDGKYEFIQVFVKKLEEANKIAKDVVESLDNDGYLWICYPKGSSKKYFLIYFSKKIFLFVLLYELIN